MNTPNIGGSTPRSAARALSVPAYVIKNALTPRNSLRQMTAAEPDTPGNKFRVATWNVVSMTGRSGEVARELGERKVDAACLPETRWRGAGTRMTGNGYKFFWSGGKKAENGVGFAFAEHLVNRVVEVNRVNDRIISVTVLLEDRPYNLISAYCPQSQLAEDMKDHFYDALERELLTTDNPLVGGDFNGHIGEDNSSCESF